MLEIFFAGFIGGAIRALVGLSKDIRASPLGMKKLRPEYFIITVLASGGLGLLVGVFVADDIRFALLAGYAGTDFIENLFKIKMKKRDWD